MTEISLNGASREEPYRNEHWLTANSEAPLPSTPLITKVSARISHTLSCTSPKTWRSVIRDVSVMMQEVPSQQVAIIDTLLAHQGDILDHPKKYERTTTRVLNGCQKILESALLPEAQISTGALASIAHNALQHIQRAVNHPSPSEFDLKIVNSHSRSSLDLLKLILAHVHKNPVIENINLKRKIDLCFDLVVLNPDIVTESRFEEWKSAKQNHYASLVEFTSYLAEPRFSRPLCNLIEYVKQVKQEISNKDSEGDIDEFKNLSASITNLEKAILKGLSATHHGAKAVGLLAKEFGRYEQDSSEFSALLHGLAHIDIEESREGCEYLILALIECDEKVRRSLLKHSLGEHLPAHFGAEVEKFEKMMRLLAEYLTYPGATDVCYRITEKLSERERPPLITIFKMIQQHDASAYLYLLPSSGEKIELPVLSIKESNRFKFLISCAEKLPNSPFPGTREYISKDIEPRD